MALLDKGLKQRVVGALVLLALAVIFLPMLFSREDVVRQVVVEAPVMPKPPAMPTDCALIGAAQFLQTTPFGPL